jgi:hypothetical protein
MNRLALWPRVVWAVRQWRDDRKHCALLRKFIAAEGDPAAAKECALPSVRMLMIFLEKFAASDEVTAVFSIDGFSVVSPPPLPRLSLELFCRWDMLLELAGSRCRDYGSVREQEVQLRIDGQVKTIFIRRPQMTPDALVALNRDPGDLAGFDGPLRVFAKTSLANEPGRV